MSFLRSFADLFLQPPAKQVTVTIGGRQITATVVEEGIDRLYIKYKINNEPMEPYGYRWVDRTSVTPLT